MDCTCIIERAFFWIKQKAILKARQTSKMLPIPESLIYVCFEMCSVCITAGNPKMHFKSKLKLMCKCSAVLPPFRQIF